jgi:hypothetical protein
MCKLYSWGYALALSTWLASTCETVSYLMLRPTHIFVLVQCRYSVRLWWVICTSLGHVLALGG